MGAMCEGGSSRLHTLEMPAYNWSGPGILLEQGLAGRTSSSEKFHSGLLLNCL